MKSFFDKLFTKDGLKRILFSFVWLALLIFVIDIITKWVVQNNLKDNPSGVTLIPNFLHIILTHNLGASFGMGSNGELGWRIFWISVSIILTGVLIFVFTKYFAKFNKLQRAALALMIGGAFGNMIDRIFYWNSIVGFDGVIDWIDFQFGSWHFATFNIADSALVIGVIIIIFVEVVNIIKDVKMKRERGDYDLSPEELEAKLKENEKDNNQQ